MNVPPTIGMAVSMRLATMTELSTTLGLEALFDLLEVGVIDAHNERIMAEEAAKRRREQR